MKRGMITVMVTTLLLMISTLSFAQMHGGIKGRLDETQQMIDRGVDQGTLTRHEARRLQEALDGLVARVDDIRRDHPLDARESEFINSDIDRLQMEISQQRQDDQVTGGYDDGPNWHNDIRARVDKAQRRIERGMENGSLTRHEARRLQQEFGAILDKIDAMSRDGRLDRRERASINRDLDRLEMDITREKRDDQRRPY
jgi:hypothetical protein